ncbi:catalytic LigB subunit of aromatic ring-opening dioxygenase [Calothrix sp. NIES-4071]|nr:catalytic LigB subunit of aromatic ring-opening dioxygenase [Calothrix sp. NIES-4071]BAZ54637.1 catalytic LigB subunit of aromatic ring-opening dioxygenase [Calothrix sp. NIES-4105]
MIENKEIMPAMFIGHGSPMNAIEKNEFSLNWAKVAKTIPTPKAILCISAHFETGGTYITANDEPKTIHDFGGFPKALFDFQYPAKGSSDLVTRVKAVVTSTKVNSSKEWGLDHGSWSVLAHLYPKANIPVVQLSMDYTKDAEFHFRIGQELKELRKEGVLIIGSGNIVHNFEYLEYGKPFEATAIQQWATEADEKLRDEIQRRDFEEIINYRNFQLYRLAAPTPEHFLPLLYILGCLDEEEKVEFFNTKVVGGAFSMTSFITRLICSGGDENP